MRQIATESNRVRARRSASVAASFIQFAQHGAIRCDSLVGFDHLAVEHLGQHDVEREQVRPCLIPDPQCIAEALGGHEHRGLALALEQGIGGNRGAHLHRIDQFRRQRRTVGHTEDVSDALDCGIRVSPWILRQELVGDRCTVGATGDHIGEGAASIDPELPAGALDASGHTHHFTHACHVGFPCQPPVVVAAYCRPEVSHPQRFGRGGGSMPWGLAIHTARADSTRSGLGAIHSASWK